MIDTDLRLHLINLDTDAGEAIFIGNAPQGTRKPLVVIRRSAGARPVTLGNTKLFARAQFDVNVITDEYPTAYPVANSILNSLHGFKGVLANGVTVQSCRCVSFPSDQSETDGDRVIRWVQSTYLFVYSEA